MYIRLFESGPGCDYIELDINYEDTGDEMYSLTEVIKALFLYTDIEEIGIGRERDEKEEK